MMEKKPLSADRAMEHRGQKLDSALPEELEAAFHCIPTGIGIYRIDGDKILPQYYNPAFFEILGYSEEHTGQICKEMTFLGVHPDALSTLQIKVAELLRNGGILRHTLQIMNDRKREYRWIRIEGSVHERSDGVRCAYCVYSDVSEQVRLEKELATANEKMQDIINAIPGGVAIYKVSDIFQAVYFSDGVPELTGYTAEEYRTLAGRNAAVMIFADDIALVKDKLHEAIQNHTAAEFEFRRQHRDGHIVWVRVQAKQIGEEDGIPLLQCVFHNISSLKEAQHELAHLVNSIPGGIASYRVEGDRFIPTFISDGIMKLSGHSREEYERMVQHDALDIIYEPDRERVSAAAKAALISGEVLDVSYRMRHKNGNLIWIHLNGRRMGPISKLIRFYAVFTGMSAESRMFQSIVNETADGVYIIDRKNYDLLYANESKSLFMKGAGCVGQKCYEALHRKTAPCEFCTLKDHRPDGKDHKLSVGGTDHFYTTRFREIDWNGIPAYIKYIQDVTEEVKTRKEKERLEQYFQTVVKNLPGGVAVVHYEKDGHMTPEFLSDGFAELTGMAMEDAWKLYQQDAMAGVHPDDREVVQKQMADYIASNESHCEITYRLLKGNRHYIWVKNTLTLIQHEGGSDRVYAVYHDITKEREEQQWLHQQYEDLILQHYRIPIPNALIIGHCNVTQNRILEIDDHTNSDLLKTFGYSRQDFFTGIAGLVVDEKERQAFLDTYLNEPALAAFSRKDTEQILPCFIKLPKEARGRYVQFKVNLVETPDTGDVTGVLTVTDITEQTISERILHQLSVTNYDFVIDLNLEQDTYTILTSNKTCHDIPPSGSHSKRVAYMFRSEVVPKDREQYAKGLDPEEIYRRLGEEGVYTISFSITDHNGDIRVKNITISPNDLRLGRVCLVRTDITDSVREQQGLLNMMAYTFELAGFINVGNRSLTLYTRQIVLENLSPYLLKDDDAAEYIAGEHVMEEDRAAAEEQFRLETILQRLSKKPGGYDFVLSYQLEAGLRYKQINVLWGDENHQTVCLVRADVTDTLSAERQAKKALEDALVLSREASRAKSDFLSAMSHDIRTPMNAIMGMTTLASAHLGDQERVADCLQKIAMSSKHLLSLINDILDMSKIERTKLTLNCAKVSLPSLIEELSDMMAPQAKTAGLQFQLQMEPVRHSLFYGDPLRTNQIMINLLSNAIKFTPEGGRVALVVEELPYASGESCARFRFTVSDTGLGMSEDFITHLFEPFTRSSRTSTIEGTGLGLSITKGLVDLMGGTIAVESKEGQGSTFQVELEFEIAQPDEGACADRRSEVTTVLDRKAMFTGKHFLVAEDNAINAEILCELLKIYGAESTVVTDGTQAVLAFQNTAPGTYDAVLMDIQMPEMNGYEATRAIRKTGRPDARRIPIVAMSANAFEEDVRASLEAGMTAHVAKPIELDVLWATLSKALCGTEETVSKDAD